MEYAPAARRPPEEPPEAVRRGNARPWYPVLGVLLVVVALTAGWTLVDAALDDRERIAAGSALVLGPDDEIALLRVEGHGWALGRSASDPDMAYALSRDGVDLTARYVPLTGTGDPGTLWAGLRKVQSVADSGSRLSAGHPLTGARGAIGRSGSLTGAGRAGSATVWLPPGRGYAVEIVVLARPGAAPGAVADATAMARGLTFPQGAP
ncbi:hypothetical protein ACFXP3_37805 [Streptomyces sp. NPDC059096]|uniref:hypothetical protein n=1 Tax=Streptomyces sp. NPDC059096 TaxID=3346727 RepID=UPI003686F39A